MFNIIIYYLIIIIELFFYFRMKYAYKTILCEWAQLYVHYTLLCVSDYTSS